MKLRPSPKKKAASTEPRYSRLHPPAGLPAGAWQIALRRQYGREQNFILENLGTDPVFSEFRITNQATQGRYRVAIRGAVPGTNYCSCPDFATNDLGTCKHIEFTLAKLERRRGGRAALARGFQPAFSEIYLRYGARRDVHFRPGNACPPKLLVAARKLFYEAEGWRLAPERFAKLEGFLGQTPRGHEVRFYDDARNLVAEVRDAERRAALLRTAFPRGPRSAGMTRLVKVALHPYQKEGALFAARAGRCLIGDDMGLGKTVQAIAAAEILATHVGVERVLVICPTSLKHQWELELARFTGRHALVISGPQAVRMKQYAGPGAWKIVAYDTLARDLAFIQRWSPDLVIVDEAQRIKNWDTIAARALKRIASPYAFVLTGTPLQNRLEELVSIVQFVDQRRLGPTWRLLQEHQIRDDAGRVVGYRNLNAIAETLAPVMIRRRKADVLTQLPGRTDKHVFVPMTRPQASLHEENGEIVARIVAKWRKYRFLSEVDQRRLTCALQNMRMSCDSTWLLDHETDHGNKADELMTMLEDLFGDEDAKVVIFSQWVGMLEIVRRRLEAKGWKHVLFHGGVPSAQRKGLVSAFRGDPSCRVFLSTDAGGVGLNLQHAATVVNMDLPWNPAILEQRAGRVHRMGQQRGVRVITFIAKGTIEEGMLSLLDFKKALYAGVLDGGSTEISLGGTRLTRFMEGVEKATNTLGTGQFDEEAGPETSDAPALASQAQLDEPVSARLAAAAGPNADALLPQPGGGLEAWRELLDTGLRFVSQLAEAAQGPSALSSPLLESDPATGRCFLRVPVPDAETVAKLGQALSALLGARRT